MKRILVLAVIMLSTVLSLTGTASAMAKTVNAAGPSEQRTAITANADVYTFNSLKLCNPNCSNPGSWVSMQAYATYSQAQVWINGHVSCNNGGDWLYFWCGVGGGNGTAALNIGVNFGTSPQQGYYVRMDIIQNGAGCYEWAYAPSPYNWTVKCEQPA